MTMAVKKLQLLIKYIIACTVIEYLNGNNNLKLCLFVVYCKQVNVVLIIIKSVAFYSDFFLSSAFVHSL